MGDAEVKTAELRKLAEAARDEDLTTFYFCPGGPPVNKRLFALGRLHSRLLPSEVIEILDRLERAEADVERLAVVEAATSIAHLLYEDSGHPTWAIRRGKDLDQAAPALHAALGICRRCGNPIEPNTTVAYFSFFSCGNGQRWFDGDVANGTKPR